MSKLKPKKGKDAVREDEVSPWKARLSRMKRFQDKNSQNWKRNERLLWGTVDDGDQDNVYSFAWGLVKSLETSIYVQNPDMMVEPYDARKMQVAKLLTSVSNFDLDQMDLKSIGNIGLTDCFTAGYFVCVESVETDKSTVKDGDEDAERAEDQRYVARRVPPKDFYVDPQATRLDLADARYIAIATYPTISDLKSDPIYSSVPSDIEDYPEASETSRPTNREGAKAGDTRQEHGKEKDPDYKTICVWECHDNISGKITYVTDEKRKEIGQIDQKVKYRIGGRKLYPVTVMAFHPAAKGWYPKAEIDLIAGQLDMLNRLDAKIYRDSMTKWSKFVTLSDLITPDQAAKITDPTIENAIIEVDKDLIGELATGSQIHAFPNLAELVAPLKDPDPKKDLFQAREMCKSEIMDIVGYGPPDRAGMPKTRSAREAIAVKEKLEARLAKRADAVADFYRMFGMKHIMTLQQTMVLARYVRIFDSAKDLAAFRQYEKDDIEGNFNFIVYAGTSAPRNTEAKRASEIQLFQTLAPMAQAGKIPIEPLVLRLADAFQWRGVDALLRNYKPATAQLAKVLFAMKQAQVPPNALPEAAAAVVQAVLTPEEIQMLAQELQQGAPGGGGAGAPPEKQAGQRGDPGGNKAEAGMM